MSDRHVTTRRQLPRPRECLVVVAFCGGLLPGLLTAHQADPKLALIEMIRRAGRESGAAAFLKQIEVAEALVPSADMAASDSKKRTALHWSILTAQSASSAKLKDACRRLVEDLLAAGADVNAEDAYGNTPLDYQQRSPAGLLEEVLIEQGGQRGYTQTAQARVLHLLDQVRAAERDNDLQRLRSLLESDLPANTVLSVRLLTPVASHESRAGDGVEAVLTAPVEASGRVVVSAFDVTERRSRCPICPSAIPTREPGELVGCAGLREEEHPRDEGANGNDGLLKSSQAPSGHRCSP